MPLSSSISVLAVGGAHPALLLFWVTTGALTMSNRRIYLRNDRRNRPDRIESSGLTCYDGARRGWVDRGGRRGPARGRVCSMATGRTPHAVPPAFGGLPKTYRAAPGLDPGETARRAP